MYALIYFDTEDFISPPESVVHRLPGQLADVMHKHGLSGCFHIMGEKARFMERHGQADVIESVRRHDVSLHYDRGSLHPTTAEEVSQLDWFPAVERVLFREVPGFQALERIFGKCSGLTQHGGTFAAPIVYAAGKLGKPFLYSPFRLPGRNVVWWCNNLLIGGYQAPFYFDQFYRDTPKFEQSLAKVDGYLAERAEAFDFTAMFGCHPVITMMQRFPDGINFSNGASPRPSEWVAPTPVDGVSIPRILTNFERLVKALVTQSNVQWTTVAGIRDLYGQRPVRVTDDVVLQGAKAVVVHGGPTWTPALSAGELLFLLARRAVERSDAYPVPQVMGPTREADGAVRTTSPDLDLGAVAREIVEAVMGCGYLPPALGAASGGIAPELALVLLAGQAVGERVAPDPERLTVDAIPGVAEATEKVRGYRKWRVHGEQYHQDGIVNPFRLQAWTLKPAFAADEYPEGVRLGRHLNPMVETEDWT